MLVVDNITRCIIKYMDRKRIVMSAVGMGLTIFLALLYVVFLRPSGVEQDVHSVAVLPEAGARETNDDRAGISQKMKAKGADNNQEEGITEFWTLSKAVLAPFTSFIFSDNAEGEQSLSGKDRQIPINSVDERQVVPQATQELTDEEIFDRLWPPSYRQALLDVEKMLVEQDFLPAGSRHKALLKDEDIYDILLTFINAAEKNGWIVGQDASLFRKGVRELLPKDIESERAELQRNGGISSGRAFPGGQQFTRSFLDQKDLLDSLLEGLKYVFSVNYALASWVTSPDCYKDDAPDYPVPGFNTLIFCCNCGLFCTTFGCEFIEDCGPQSAQCNVPLGCLNLVCGAWPNAIWDPETGTCGCG